MDLPEGKICEAEDCEQMAEVICHLIDYDDEHPNGEDVFSFYCIKHAKENGYCYCCGEFWAGLEEFDFAENYGHLKGCCPICSDMIKTECGEFDEEEF